MSSYPIVLKDEFCIITFSYPPTLATFDSALAPGPMKAGRDWSTNGPMRRADSDKTCWQNMPATKWMASRSFAPSTSTILSIVRPVPGNLHTTRGKSLKISASVPRSGKKSPSRPLRIFPATEPKPGNPTHDFLIPARFEIWSERRHKRAWDQNLVRSFLSFSAGAWSLLGSCLGLLTPSFHFVSFKPRRVAADIEDEKSPAASLASNPERSFDG